MIGPRTKKMKSRKVCTGCDAAISRDLGGTAKFPKKRTVNYCTHEGLGQPGTVSFIKDFPYMPKWCPALKA